MSKIAVVYWSSTGNTQTMADFVAQGAREAGAQVSQFSADEFRPETLPEYDAVAFGCPAMGAEELEENEFAPMFSACEGSLSGKRVGLFGSYGWGDGEWMRTWEGTCRADGANLVDDGVICCETPDEEAEAACIALGKLLAE